ncbi:helix-turn-helix domain-containing protein [Paenibacillus sp. FSL P4-0502]|uniref:helix-turn-helix domain-containing protein n=1 Tax=Paenibacillus sp. FSL P4-0502 TaxID=2975319 RepID=UPI0030FB26C0
MISFKPLMRLMFERDMSKMEFVEFMQISPTTATKMWKNEYVSLKIIDDICKAFECNLSDVIEYIPSNPSNNEENVSQ